MGKTWPVGVEIELLAPVGKTRADLADAIAQRYNGTVHRFFSPQSEVSRVPGMAVFHNLTLGYEVRRKGGEWFVRCVDDLTLQQDLNRHLPPQAGWYRIVSDDPRWLRLIAKKVDPNATVEQVLEPMAEFLETSLEWGEHGMVKLSDEMGDAIAIAAPAPGERGRACEVITAPLLGDDRGLLGDVLDLARTLQFTIPQEGAIHLHFDAQPLCFPGVVCRLVQVFTHYSEDFKQLLGTNPHCRGLGGWEEDLIEKVQDPAFLALTWTEAQKSLKELPLTKYCDFNLYNLVHNLPQKNTFEVRILPVWLEAEKLLNAIALFEAILFWIITTPQLPDLNPLPFPQLLTQLSLKIEAF